VYSLWKKRRLSKSKGHLCCGSLLFTNPIPEKLPEESVTSKNNLRRCLGSGCHNSFQQNNQGELTPCFAATPDTSHGYKTAQGFQDSTACACFRRPFILRQTGPVVENHGMQKQLLINVSAWHSGMKSENTQFRMLCDQSIDKTSKAIWRSITFKLKNSLLMTLRQFKSHPVDQVRRFHGLADKGKDWIEHQHQNWMKEKHLTWQIPNFEKQQMRQLVNQRTKNNSQIKTLNNSTNNKRKQKLKRLSTEGGISLKEERDTMRPEAKNTKRESYGIK